MNQKIFTAIIGFKMTKEEIARLLVTKIEVESISRGRAEPDRAG